MPVQCTCRRCGVVFSKKANDVARGSGLYCSHACYWGTPAERFWPRVDRSGDGCWEWRGPRGRGGYGKASIDRQTTGAHRVAWILTHGAIPDGLWVLHHCDNRPCCRPDHLYLGTSLDNARDKTVRGRNATGDRSGPRLHPERMRRGPTHYRYQNSAYSQGVKNVRARLTEADVLAIRAAYAEGARISLLARRYGVGHSTVTHVVQRTSWTHI